MLSAIKLIPPGSIGFLVLCTAVGLALMPFARSGRRPILACLALLYVGYLILAVPKVANALAASLSQTNVDLSASARPFDVIVVLDGDNRRGRVRTVRQLEDGPSPPPIVVLTAATDRWVVDNLVLSGVRADQITPVSGAETTRDQVDLARAAITAGGWHAVGLVASRLQSPRLRALTRTWRPQPTIVAAPVDDEAPRGGVWAFVPSYVALRISRDAIYERAALTYYRWRGWI